MEIECDCYLWLGLCMEELLLSSKVCITVQLRLLSLFMSSSRKRIKLLTYPMCLSTNPPKSSNIMTAGSSSSGSALAQRRWVRGFDESCVAGMYRHSRLLTEYVAKYKFDDEQWRPLLQLPCGNPVGMEMRARHCNMALRHIVQKGHAMYYIVHSQHTVLEPRGLIEQSHVTCSMGIKGERLRTSIIHEGPVDAADRRGRRGVLGISQVEGYGTWFDRKPMLWQRSRRIGALQAHLGAYNWEMIPPGEVGRKTDAETMLLGPPHTKMVGGGCTATGIVASTLIAGHPFLYMGEFDAPAIAAVEAVQQVAYKCCGANRLVRRKECEPLHTLAWSTITPPPYVPLESDLPFQVSMSAPSVYDTRAQFPTTTIGSPFHDGAPIAFMEYHMRQGAEHYLYDNSVASRSMKWWSQAANVPFNGMMWVCRDGNLNKLKLRDTVRNPFDPEERRRSLHQTIASSQRAKSRVAKYAKTANKKPKSM